MEKLIEYFAKRHLLSNVIFFGLLFMGLIAWFSIGKEELPEFESNWVRVQATYPGASAEDVELFVTRPIEEELKGIIGIEEVLTTSSIGNSSIRIVTDGDYPNQKEIVQDIKDAVLRANLPAEVRDLPRIRQFKSSEKAILDIGIYHKKYRFLDSRTRAEVQKYVLSFESQLLSLKEVSSVEKRHYRSPELQVLIDPAKLNQQEISLSEIKNQIRKNHIRVPLGNLNNKGESRVTVLNELESIEGLQSLVLRSNYQGNGIGLNKMAKIRNDFRKSGSIFKINGHEGVFLNIRKNISTDIITAQKTIMKFIKNFREANRSAPIEIVLMDDESYAVTNRLNIVSSNGILGFIFIVVVLLIFLNIKVGFWVAMGIPFTMAFTLIIANYLGYTVNNMTLAGIIIVLGIVVDDAIIIAENITRHRERGTPIAEAVIVGTTEMVRPIFASIITTCVAFIPLMFFEGFFGKFVSYIPLIVILMLGGSLFESILILPAHIAGKTPIIDNFSKEKVGHWFHRYEEKYARILLKILHFRAVVIGVFILFLVGASFIYFTKMKFVMFPREESKEVFIKVTAPKHFTRLQTAKAIGLLEKVFVEDKRNVVAVRSSIALSRRGGGVKENEASILVELRPAVDRPTPLNKLIKQWKKKSKKIPELVKVKILRGRWGHASGNAIELRVQENDNLARKQISEFLVEKMKEHPSIIDVELDRPMEKKEYFIQLDQRKLLQFNVEPTVITSTLRSFIEGTVLYSINKGDEEIDVRLTVPDKDKLRIDSLLSLRVENKSGRLIHLKKLITVREASRPVNIKRADFKRMTMIYANPSPRGKDTPVMIAEYLEKNIFPEVFKKYPTAVLSFKGEIEDTREGLGEFKASILLVMAVIFMILVIMFDSLKTPFLVLAIVPFGLAGVVYTFYFHGMKVYGFFAAIGSLGMIGVVVNDAIVMIDKIERNFKKGVQGCGLEKLSHLAGTRLRPVLVTTLTTVAGVLPTAYGVAGHDSMLAEMMLAMGWGLLFGTVVTLLLIPLIYSYRVSR